MFFFVQETDRLLTWFLNHPWWTYMQVFPDYSTYFVNYLSIFLDRVFVNSDTNKLSSRKGFSLHGVFSVFLSGPVVLLLLCEAIQWFSFCCYQLQPHILTQFIVVHDSSVQYRSVSVNSSSSPQHYSQRKLCRCSVQQLLNSTQRRPDCSRSPLQTWFITPNLSPEINKHSIN